VLQGRMGGKLSNARSGGPVLPLADNEPIPMRGQSPAAGNSSVPPPISPPPSQPIAAIREGLTLHAGGEEKATMVAAYPVAAKASLTVVRSPEDASTQGRQIVLTRFPFIIGRVEGSLLIQDANLSRRHAQITYEAAGRTYLITDLNSSNGSRMNGVAMVPGQAKELTSGASISLGPNVVLRFDLV